MSVTIQTDTPQEMLDFLTILRSPEPKPFLNLLTDDALHQSYESQALAEVEGAVEAPEEEDPPARVLPGLQKLMTQPSVFEKAGRNPKRASCIHKFPAEWLVRAEGFIQDEKPFRFKDLDKYSHQAQYHKTNFKTWAENHPALAVMRDPNWQGSSAAQPFIFVPKKKDEAPIGAPKTGIIERRDPTPVSEGQLTNIGNASPLWVFRAKQFIEQNKVFGLSDLSKGNWDYLKNHQSFIEWAKKQDDLIVERGPGQGRPWRFIPRQFDKGVQRLATPAPVSTNHVKGASSGPNSYLQRKAAEEQYDQFLDGILKGEKS